MPKYQVSLYPAYPKECDVTELVIEASTPHRAAHEGSRYLTRLDDYPNHVSLIWDQHDGVTTWKAVGRASRLNGAIIVKPYTENVSKDERPVLYGSAEDRDTYVIGIDEHGNAIEGDVMAYLAIVLPPNETIEWTDCTGECLDNAPPTQVPTDDDFMASFASV